jgi:hypothetical protein
MTAEEFITALSAASSNEGVVKLWEKAAQELSLEQCQQVHAQHAKKILAAILCLSHAPELSKDDSGSSLQ